MATPTSPESRLHARGAKKASEWGTAVALGASNEILLEGASGLGPPKRSYLPAKESDTPVVREGDLGDIDPVELSLPFCMRYDPGALGTLIACSLEQQERLHSKRLPQLISTFFNGRIQ